MARNVRSLMSVIGDEVRLGDLDAARNVSGRDPHLGAESFGLCRSRKFRHQAGGNDAAILAIKVLYLGNVCPGHREQSRQKDCLLRGDRKKKRRVLLLGWRGLPFESLKQKLDLRSRICPDLIAVSAYCECLAEDTGACSLTLSGN